MSVSVSRLLTLASLSLTLIPMESRAVQLAWPPEQKACAEGIGVQLRTVFHAPETSLRTLTWISPVVLRGTVAAIQSDITGAYHTQVVVNVSNVEKGSVAGSTVRVMFEYGKVWSPARGMILDLWGSEDTHFTEGEDLVLFLQTDYAQGPPGNEDAYRLTAGQYTLSPKGKYIVQGQSLRSARNTVELYPLQSALDEIRFTVQKQTSNCSN